MMPHLVDFFFTPFFGLLVESRSTSDSQSMTATAVAQTSPIMCHAPPLMTCYPTEVGDDDVMDPDNAGRQLLLKAGRPNGPPVAGNFGLLETGNGAGANNVDHPGGCRAARMVND